MNPIRFTALALVAGIILAAPGAYATGNGGGNCRGNSCDQGGDVDVDVGQDVDTTVDVEVGGQTVTVPVEVAGDQLSANTDIQTRALALANSLGGVDIGECLGSEQFGTPLFSRQWLKLNAWCAGLWYDVNGMNDAAARMRCTLKPIRKLYDGEDDCVTSQTMRPRPAPVQAPPPIAAAEVKAQRELIEKQAAQLDDQAARIEALERRLQAADAARHRYAREQAQRQEAERQEAQTFLERYAEVAAIPAEENEK